MDILYTPKEFKEYVEKVLFTIENDSSPFSKTLPAGMFKECLSELGKRGSECHELFSTRCILNLGIGLSLASYLRSSTAFIPGRQVIATCSIVSAAEYLKKHPEELRKLKIYFTSNELFHLLKLLDDDAIRRILASAKTVPFGQLYNTYAQCNEKEFGTLLYDTDICDLSLEWCKEFTMSKSWELYLNKLLEDPANRESVIELLDSLFPNLVKIIPLFLSLNSSEEVDPHLVVAFEKAYEPALAELEYQIMNYSNLPELTSYRRNQYIDIIKAYSFIFDDVADKDYIPPRVNPLTLMYVVFNVSNLVFKRIREDIPETYTFQTTEVYDDRLGFPSRFLNEMSPKGISAQEQEAVLREIYNLYGGSFENMSCEEFLYLFGAAFVKQPASYNPPYYWTGEESTMKALLRILYTQQPRMFKTLILHISDKEAAEKSHNWSRNKDKVAYRDIETNIIKLIYQVTGKTLKVL